MHANPTDTSFRSALSVIAQKYVIAARAEGRLEGRAEVLLDTLATRGIDLFRPERLRLMACTDIPTLDLWLQRAASACSVPDVFGGIEQEIPSTAQSSLGTPAEERTRRFLETYTFQSDFARRYYSRGRAEGLIEGRAEAQMCILAVGAPHEPSIECDATRFRT